MEEALHRTLEQRGAAGDRPNSAEGSGPTIVTVEPGARLLLRSQMRLPGRAELTLTVTDLPGGGCRYLQKVDFRPSALFCRAYWYAQIPAHQLVFGVMASTITWRAEHGLASGEIESVG